MQVTVQEVPPSPEGSPIGAAGMRAGEQPSAGSWALWQGCGRLKWWLISIRQACLPPW